MTQSTNWTIWHGGDCPMHKDAIIDIRMRNGKVLENVTAGRYLWARPRREADGNYSQRTFINGGTIVAYREIVEEA
ncbi:hypothetical protein [Rhizobium esperanzae]|uniref:Uncharacterized protein n=1 Tax=Rhizobium esperanzae TaxID=1967781 RepID=A0A7W6R1L5_9HYPH|nr:hypothetical protein [Rhizobium esperanzae]MBB4235014.1 hypothetical protein [Rhizobium esperanzae]